MRSALLWVVYFVLLGCSDAVKTAGGAGSESTNGLTARILSGTSPVVGARVKIRPADFVRNPFDTASLSDSVLNAVTDSTGIFKVEKLPQGNYRIEVMDSGAVTSVAYVGDTAVNLGDLTLSPFAQVSGTVALPAAASVAWVRVFGTDHAVLSDAQGNFQLDSLPSANVVVQAYVPAISSTVAVQNVQANGVIAGLVLTNPPHVTIVDDFADGNGQTLLGTWWYWNFDSSLVSPVLPASGRPFDSALQASAIGYVGTALHLSYTQSSAGGFILAGCGLTSSGSRDFSGLDSIEFWEKGNSKIGVALQNNYANKAWAHKMADTAWTRMVILPTDFEAANATVGNVSWSMRKDSVSDLVIFASDGTDLWISSIKFYGISPIDLQ